MLESVSLLQSPAAFPKFTFPLSLFPNDGKFMWTEVFFSVNAVGGVSHVFALVSAAAALANGFSSTEDRCFRLGGAPSKRPFL